MGPPPIVEPPRPLVKPTTEIYYNRGDAKLYDMGAARLESLLNEAGLNKQANKVDADMPAAQQAKFVNRFNNSDYAQENNLHLNTNNSMMSKLEEQPDSARMGTAVAAVIIPGVTTLGPGDLIPGGRMNDPQKPSNSNNNNTPMSSSSGPAPASSGNMGNDSGNMGNDNGPMSSPTPAPVMSSTPSSPPSQSGGSGGGGSMGTGSGGGDAMGGGGGGGGGGGSMASTTTGGGGMGGDGGGGMGMSDINLKDNIQLIDNALNRLFKINLNNGILS
jgi:hypothetical protein